MNHLELKINGDTTITEALEILKCQVDILSNSEEAAKFNKENPSWSKLFRQSFKPYHDALMEYEEALKLNEWLNGKNPANRHLTLKEVFSKMTDQERISLFQKRVESNISGIFDEFLKAWWLSRY